MTTAKKLKKRGPTGGRVKVQGDWADTIKKALEKTRPNQGWPTQDTAKGYAQQSKAHATKGRKNPIR